MGGHVGPEYLSVTNRYGPVHGRSGVDYRNESAEPKARAAEET